MKNDTDICLYVYIHLSICPHIRLLDSLSLSLSRCHAVVSLHLSCVVAEEYEVRAVPASLGKYKLTVYCITVSKLHIRR